MPAPLPFAARQQYLQQGYAVLPNVLDQALVARLRTAALSATRARHAVFAAWPTTESITQGRQVMSDPFYNQFKRQIDLQRRLRRYYRGLQRQRRALRRSVNALLRGRTQDELSGEELWQLSQLVAQSAVNATGAHCTATVATDAQMRRAIDEARVNAWMTEPALKAIVTDERQAFAAPLGELAEMVGGVGKPVIFCDAPLLRLAYDNPVGYHCTAPQIGVRTNPAQRSNKEVAVTLLIFTYQPTKMRLPPYVLQNSHKFVRAQYMHSVRANALVSPFRPMEAHVPFQLRQFTFDQSVVGRPLMTTSQSTAAAAKPRDDAAVLGESVAPQKIAEGDIGPGTVMVVDPHLLMSFGPNMTGTDEVIYRLHVVRRDAIPNMRVPSWIHTWRMSTREVNFNSPVVFPPLQGETAARER